MIIVNYFLVRLITNNKIRWKMFYKRGKGDLITTDSLLKGGMGNFDSRIIHRIRPSCLGLFDNFSRNLTNALVSGITLYFFNYHFPHKGRNL